LFDLNEIVAEINGEIDSIKTAGEYELKAPAVFIIG